MTNTESCNRPGCLNAEHHDLSSGDFPHRLYDADTATDIGPATAEQVTASNASEAKGENGIILIDGDGLPLRAGDCQTWTGVRRVYTQ